MANQHRLNKQSSIVNPARPVGVSMKWTKLLRKCLQQYQLYLLLLPTLLYFAIFEYGPMYGVQIAFKDFNPVAGINGSHWIGFTYFVQFFHSFMFWTVLRNTILIKLYGLALFPVPVFLAVLINHLVSKRFKRFVQTITYAPHFISTVVIVGMLYIFLSPRTGLVNQVIEAFGGKSIFFVSIPAWFKTIFVFSDLWQNAGWQTIIYLAALTSINPELHESAVIDGASKLRRIRHIDIPGIWPTVIILMILQIGYFMSVGFEKVYLMENPLNLPAAEVIQTYLYKVGLLGSQYSYAAAIGLFNSVIDMILVLLVNELARRKAETSLW